MSSISHSLLVNVYNDAPAEHPESVAEHMVGVHSPDFDHETFLGRAEAERFDQLPPEEAKRRLG